MKEYDSLSDNEKRNMLASVANLYYNAEMTQNQIAERFFTSRSKISRMLKEARQLGIVEDQDFRAMGPQCRAGTGIYEKICVERCESDFCQRSK